MNECFISSRSGQLSQVILNLLGNALDAVDKMENPWVELKNQLIDSKVRITITDCGTGIPADVVAKMMNPFFTTKAVGKGTGLGLSISKGIVEAHQGILKYNRSSQNTQFIIDLPTCAKPNV